MCSTVVWKGRGCGAEQKNLDLELQARALLLLVNNRTLENSILLLQLLVFGHQLQRKKRNFTEQ
jgi:hypothetical protein